MLTLRRTNSDCFHVTVRITSKPDLFSFVEFHFEKVIESRVQVREILDVRFFLMKTSVGITLLPLSMLRGIWSSKDCASSNLPHDT